MLFILITIVAVLAIALYLFMQQPQFGTVPKGEALAKVQQSIHYKNGKFQNQSPTTTLAEDASYFQALKDFLFNKSKQSRPITKLPSIKTNLKQLDKNEDVLVWFGHSSYFLQVDGKRFLVDPVFSGNISPIKISGSSYAGSDVYSVDDLPAIDYLLITHDHWDHLDYKTVIGLKNKVATIVCGLGVAAHFERWGFNMEQVHELDWHSTIQLTEGFTLTATPGRHFSGRGFKAAQSIWVSYVLQTPNQKLFLGGDSGYDTHFAAIGQQYGPFDLAILECGQYHKNWRHIHMLPPQVVQVAIDLKAAYFMPVHWAKFTLALHAWDEPIKAVVAESKQKNVPITHPMIGEKLNLHALHEKNKEWWVGLH